MAKIKAMFLLTVVICATSFMLIIVSNHTKRQPRVITNTTPLIEVTDHLVGKRASKRNIHKSSVKRANIDAVISSIDLTIVTAYFDIGVIQKAKTRFFRSPEIYYSWARVFRHLLNPLVVYTNSEIFVKLMQHYRTDLSNRTKIFLFDINSSWAFGKREAIQNVYDLNYYPSYIRENPTIANYTCVQNAKYEVVADAASKNFFNTRYFAWLDIGLFRGTENNKRNFVLNVPQNFNESQISVCEVNQHSMKERMWRIFMKKLVWICGCIFVGEREIILRYTEQYKRSIDYFLSRKLMHTDEQILFATYTKLGRNAIKPEIELQLYNATGTNYNRFFFLGYLMRSFV